MTVCLRHSCGAVAEIPAVPYIPFKADSRANHKLDKTGLWRRMYHYYSYKHEEFSANYPKRSNVGVLRQSPAPYTRYPVIRVYTGQGFVLVGALLLGNWGYVRGVAGGGYGVSRGRRREGGVGRSLQGGKVL